MAYADLDTIHVPATGGVAPAAWGLQIRENQEFLIDPPACSAFHSTTQTVPSGSTFTTLNANSEDFDNDGMHSTVSSTSRITIQTAGRYNFQAIVNFDLSSTGSRGVRFKLNGTGVDNTGMSVLAASTFPTLLNVVKTFVLSVGDFVEIECRQASTVDRAVTLAEFSAKFITR